MKGFDSTERIQNVILASLSSEDYEWLQPKLQEIDLRIGDSLYRKGEPITDVYFPITCLFSLTNSTDQGDSVEIGVTGREGVAGATLFLGVDTVLWDADVQIAGRALKLAKDDFKVALDRCTSLRKKLAAFIHLKMLQVAQSALCNRFHSVEERLSRWLLAAQDHTQTSTFSLTREVMAQMIGAGRPAVSITTGTLQAAGLIRSSRGEITILNRDAMEETACECYLVTKAALDQYLAS